MVKTRELAGFTSRFKAMLDRGMMAEEYATADEAVDAYLSADQVVRDRACYPPMSGGDGIRVRADLLAAIARGGA